VKIVIHCIDVIIVVKLTAFTVIYFQVQWVVHFTTMSSSYCQSNYLLEIICIVMYV